MASGVKLPIYTVDAFSSEPFGGNPAAVCPLPDTAQDLPDDVLQKIAAEMNLSETAFIKRLQPQDSFKTGSTFGLRWFTPVAESELCGHATLATATVLFRILGNESAAITFKTLSGDLVVRQDGGLIHMDFPVGLTQPEKESDRAEIIKSLGSTPGVEGVAFCPSLRYLLVHLKDGWSRSEFEQWKLKMDQLNQATDSLVVLIVTTRGRADAGYKNASGATYDFVSRCFAPWMGIPEDPVTGSAQTVLAHYWAKLLGKNDFFVRQCSARGGEITLRLRGERVEILSTATVMLEGTLQI